MNERQKKTLKLVGSATALLLAGGGSYYAYKENTKTETKKEEEKPKTHLKEESKVEDKKEEKKGVDPFTPPANIAAKEKADKVNKEKESTTSTKKEIDSKPVSSYQEIKTEKPREDTKVEKIYNVSVNKDGDVVDKTLEETNTTTTTVDISEPANLNTSETTPNNNIDTDDVNQEALNNKGNHNIKKDYSNNTGTYNIKKDTDNNNGNHNIKKDYSNNTGTYNIKKEDNIAIKELTPDAPVKETRYVDTNGENIEKSVKDKILDKKEIANYKYERTYETENARVHVYSKIIKNIVFIDVETNKELKRFTDSYFVKAPDVYDNTYKLIEKEDKDNLITFKYKKIEKVKEDLKVQEEKIEEKNIPEVEDTKPKEETISKDDADKEEDEKIVTRYVLEDGKEIKKVEGISTDTTIPNYEYVNTVNTKNTTTHYYKYKRVEKIEDTDNHIEEVVKTNENKYDTETNVLQEGTTTKKKKIYIIKDDKEIFEREEIVEGQPRIIEKGLKPTVKETIKTTEEVNFDYKTVEDDTKYEDYKEVKPGVVGVIEKTYEIIKDKENSKEISKKLISEEKIKESSPEITTVGTKPLYTETDETENIEIPFTSEIVIDDSIFIGDTEETEGKVGKQVNKYKVRKNNKDNTTEKILVETKIENEPVNKIIKQGIKERFVKTTEDIEKVNKEFSTVIQEDDTQFTDYEEVLTEGVDGKIVETVETTKDLKEKTEVKTIVNTKEISPVNKIVKKGTKPLYTETETKRKEIETFETIIEIKDDKFVDDVEEVEGHNGEVEYIYKIIKNEKTGELRELLISKNIITPVKNKVIIRGSKETKEITKEEIEEIIPYSTKEIIDNDKFADFIEEKQGKVGKRVLKYTVIKDLKNPDSSPLKTLDETVEIEKPIDTVIIRGTKELTRVNSEPREVETVLHNTVERIEDSNLLEGETRTVEGTNGILKEYYIDTIDNKTNKIISSELVRNERVKEPKNTIIYVGTKPIIEYIEDRENKKNEPIITKYETDSNMFEDESVIVDEGKSKIITQIFSKYKNNKTNQIIETLKDEIITEGKPKIIKIGTKPLQTKITKTKTEIIPFDFVVDTVKDDSKYIDEYTVVQEGKNGEITIEYEEVINNKTGEKQERVLSKQIASGKNVVKEKRRYGSKPIFTFEDKIETEPIKLDPNTPIELVEDSSLYPNEVINEIKITFKNDEEKQEYESKKKFIQIPQDGIRKITKKEVYEKGVKKDNLTAIVNIEETLPKKAIVRVGTRKDNNLESHTLKQTVSENSLDNLNVYTTVSRDKNKEWTLLGLKQNKTEVTYRVPVNTENNMISGEMVELSRVGNKVNTNKRLNSTLFKEPFSNELLLENANEYKDVNGHFILTPFPRELNSDAGEVSNYKVDENTTNVFFDDELSVDTPSLYYNNNNVSIPPSPIGHKVKGTIKRVDTINQVLANDLMTANVPLELIYNLQFKKKTNEDDEYTLSFENNKKVKIENISVDLSEGLARVDNVVERKTFKDLGFSIYKNNILKYNLSENTFSTKDNIDIISFKRNNKEYIDSTANNYIDFLKNIYVDKLPQRKNIYINVDNPDNYEATFEYDKIPNTELNIKSSKLNTDKKTYIHNISPYSTNIYISIKDKQNNYQEAFKIILTNNTSVSKNTFKLNNNPNGYFLVNLKKEKDTVIPEDNRSNIKYSRPLYVKVEDKYYGVVKPYVYNKYDNKYTYTFNLNYKEKRELKLNSNKQKRDEFFKEFANNIKLIKTSNYQYFNESDPSQGFYFEAENIPVEVKNQIELSTDLSNEKNLYVNGDSVTVYVSDSSYDRNKIKIKNIPSNITPELIKDAFNNKNTPNVEVSEDNTMFSDEIKMTTTDGYIVEYDGKVVKRVNSHIKIEKGTKKALEYTTGVLKEDIDSNDVLSKPEKINTETRIVENDKMLDTTIFVREEGVDGYYKPRYYKLAEDNRLGNIDNKTVKVYTLTDEGNEQPKEILIKPQVRVVVKGTVKTEDTESVTETEVIEPEVKYEYDHSIPIGKTKVYQEGKAGKKENTYLVNYRKHYINKKTGNIVEKPTSEELKDFDNTLEIQRKEISKEIVNSKELTEMSPRIIKIGAGVFDKNRTEVKVIPYSRYNVTLNEFLTNPIFEKVRKSVDLEKLKQKVKDTYNFKEYLASSGEDGQKQLKYKINDYVEEENKWIPSKEVLVSTEILKDSIPEVYIKGEKNIYSEPNYNKEYTNNSPYYKENIKESKSPIVEVIEYDNSKYEDEFNIRQEGTKEKFKEKVWYKVLDLTESEKEEYRKIYPNVILEDVVPVKTETEIISTSKPKIIVKGTKPLLSYINKQENVSYDTEYKEVTTGELLSKDIFEDDYSNVLFEGENGIKEVEYKKTVETINNVRTEKETKTGSERIVKQPKNRIIIQGTKKRLETYIGEPIVVEYKTRYEYDNSLWNDEEYTYYEQEGRRVNKSNPENGVKRVITKIVRKDNKEEKSIEEQFEKLPINKVIVIGTKDRIYIERDQSELREIPYKITYEYDNTKSKEYRHIKQEGESGYVYDVYNIHKDLKENERIIRKEFLYTSNKASDIKETKNKIIVVGTLNPIVEKELEPKLTELAFSEEIIYDNNMFIDEEVIRNKGTKGLLTQNRKEITYNNSDGTSRKEIVFTTETRKEPVKRIIVKGTKPLRTESSIKTEYKSIPFNTRIVYKEDMLVDSKENIKFSGENGEQTRTYKEITDNKTGKVTKVYLTEYRDTKTPKDRVIERGTKPLTRKEIQKNFESIKKQIVYKNDSNMFEDEERIEEGTDGIVTIETEVTLSNKDNSIVNSRELSKKTTTPVKHTVITRGLKPLYSYKVEYSQEREVKPQEITKYTDELYVGETRIIEGISGRERDKYSVRINNKTGLVDKKTLDKIETLSRKVDKTILIGTAPVEAEREEYKNIETTISDIRKANPNLLKGIEREINPYTNKVVQQKYKVVYNKKTGNVVSRTLAEEKVLDKGQARQIEYGTAEEIKYKETEKKIKEPGVKYIDVPEWFDDKEEIVQKGQRGEVTEEYEVTKHWQQGVIKRELIRTIEGPQYKQQIVKRGTRPSGTISTEQINGVIIYKDTFIYDDTLLAGERKVEKEGVKGTHLSTYKVTRNKQGKTIKRELVDYKITKPAEDSVIRVGTKQDPGLLSEILEIPFETIVRTNPSLKPDETKTIQKGEDGSEKSFYILDSSNPGIIYKIEKGNRITLKEMKPEIIEAGVNVKHPIYRMPIWKKYKGVKKDYVDAIPKTFEEIKSLSEDKRYELAKREDVHWFKYSKDTIEYLYNSLDKEKVKEHFLKYINEERAKHGRKPIQYDEKLIHYSQIRSDELATIGDIRVNNKAHTRLDGSSWITVFDGSEFDGLPLGENLAMTNALNPYRYLSEKWIAEQFFKQWKGSKLHYENFMDTRNKSMAFSIQYTEKVWSKMQNSYLDLNGIIATQLFEKQY